MRNDDLRGRTDEAFGLAAAKNDLRGRTDEAFGLAAAKNMFADIDSMDPDAWAAYLAEDVTMRFGNGEPVHGRRACRDAWAGFCATIDGVRHEIVQQWEDAPATIVEANVTYTRKDGRSVTVPCVTIYRTNAAEEIDDYRIFIDVAPVMA
jgi:ketosteroid isomerase-like protein